ncbi:A disintegrin and metalloproteinase with thrombospondin motifs 6-like [Dendronephthya gigantea]|uniref:A disintegrin and metalloproteinase with thrombospondin motifs 6-like n=1 Tax=Dendronephthya gigantea TaxID=151771 RepID=UPI00106B966A|nr:A disintegrin and metalloproteinase with thrombospondin motifs 6-like [Dendronephthya gigantea]
MRVFHVLLAVITMLYSKGVNPAHLKQPRHGIKEQVEAKLTKISDAPTLRYKLHIFGEDLTLNLFRNKQLAIPHAQVIRRDNGRTVSRENLDDYYTGHIEGKPGSNLAVKIHNGCLSGVIMTDSHIITIHGVNESLHHVITRQEHEDSALRQGGDNSSPNAIPHVTRKKRSASDNRYVEVLVVADRYTTEAYGNFTEQYLMSVVYLLNAVMQDDSIGDVKVIYTVVKLMILSGEEEGFDVDKNNIVSSMGYISLFATWTSTLNNPDDSSPEHFDQAILITKKVCGKGSSCPENGRGYLNDMCHSVRSVATTIAAGLSAALTAAHESGHNLGLGHDSGDCSKGYIMNSILASGKNAFSWSSCSRTNLQSSFSSNKFSCLNDVPPGLETIEDLSVVNLAKNFSGDEQCRLMYGDKFSHCGPYKSDCTVLYCRESGTNTCRHRSTPPLEGTECGTYKWCKNGKCVDKPIPDPIDGQWGSWSQTFSSCTSSCGMGVRYRTRSCDSPPPEYFGKNCVGESKGHYETCNTEDCPAGTDDLFTKQCKEKSQSYSPYTGRSSCLLNCLSGRSVISYQSTVVDGTLCSKYQDERDVCVSGVCTKVGCNRTFARKSYDRCRVCSGDGSTCRLVNSSYNTVHKGYGKNAAAVMFTLPTGSANLLVQEKLKTWNNIGLKDQNDNWIIHDQTGSSVKFFAGSRITFERSASRSLETMAIDGPTTEPLKVMFIYFYENNDGVLYEYYERLSTPDATPLTFIWRYSLSECNAVCAGGVKTKITTCHRQDDGTEVGKNNCDSSTEPVDTVACNTNPCEPSWEEDNWRDCSADCGPNGTRSRTVECRQKVSADVVKVLADDKCSGSKPIDSENCNRKDCAPEWFPAAWSACSKEKCEGIRTRTLSCKKLLVSGQTKDMTDSDCPSTKPITELICNLGVKCYDWKHVYPNCSECRGYFGGEEKVEYKPVGCYKIKNRNFGAALNSFTIDTNNKNDVVKNCGRLAWERARRMFAVSGNGDCYGSMNAHRVFSQGGEASDCTGNIIGGEDSVYVYALNGKVLLPTPTCYSVEDDKLLTDNSQCDLNEKPAPKIQVCCEDMCQENCYKTSTEDKYCAIPFIYKGKSYYECIPNEKGRMWCSTTSNYDLDGEGAECEEPCRRRTTSGKCCSFPFIYRGRLYNTCTSAGVAQPWCSLTSNYDLDRLRETCV